MRIAIRLWIALLVTIVLVLATGVLIRVRQEQRLLLEVTLRDRRFFAHVLEAALWGHDGGPDPLEQAQAMLRREGVADAHIEARLVGLLPDSKLPRPRLPGVTEPLAQGKVMVGAHEDELLTYVPLHGTGVAVELAEPHAVAELVARISWWALWTQVLALTALAGLVTLVLVRWLVGKPLARLVWLARQVGGGNLSARAPVPQGQHEVAVLAREMNGMAEALEKARRALEELDAERVTALEQLRHADRLRTVGQLASALAHELGTPLNVISGHARLIEQEVVANDSVRESTRTIIEQTSRMISIIRELLGFARKRSPQVAVHELSALARQAARTLEPLAQRHRVQIEVQAETPVSVQADAQHIVQALTNLLTNAMHAMPEGGPVRVETTSEEAVPPTGIHEKPGRYACVTVIDTGTGFDQADLPLLFEPFFTRKSEGEGTGLGLSVVEGIAREHHGWVTASSERGRGSRFRIYLPLVNESSTPSSG